MGFKWRVITFIGMYSGNQMENDYLYKYLQWESNGE